MPSTTVSFELQSAFASREGFNRFQTGPPGIAKLMGRTPRSGCPLGQDAIVLVEERGPVRRHEAGGFQVEALDFGPSAGSHGWMALCLPSSRASQARAVCQSRGTVTVETLYTSGINSSRACWSPSVQAASKRLMSPVNSYF